MSSSKAASGAGPLDGVRVLEIGQLVAGPFCGQLLGDLGAEVIKVELPGVGDPMRQWGWDQFDTVGLWWSVIGRNKKSVTLDLRQESSRAVVRELVKRSDILIENFRPGTLERWNLDPVELLREHPGLIVVRISGFGQSGPDSEKAGYGSIGEAMGGLRYISGNSDVPPARIGISIGDSLAAALSAIGALAALQHRHATGLGQVVDTAIYEAVLAFMESLVPDFALSGYVRERAGTILPGVAPSNIYPTRDGKSLLIAANQDSVFRRLATAMARPDWMTEERYATHTARGESQAELDAEISAWTLGLSAEETLMILNEHAVPVTLIYRAPEMLEDPHFAARQAIVDIEHPTRGLLKMQNVFPRLSLTPGRVRWPGPELGQHNSEILQDVLGLTDSQVADLVGPEGEGGQASVSTAGVHQ